MIKLPKDKYGNEGWAVKAVKAHRCESNRYGCVRIIEPGIFYYRAVMFPGEFHDGPAPWVMKICRECLYEDMQAAFDALVPVQTPTAAHQPPAQPRTPTPGTTTSAEPDWAAESAVTPDGP